ncbi:MAG: arginine--tRNA ligase [Acidimicrobiia bacterium]|nr:arginine--tRNA ligase [Acidimicrobiia bacterium]MYC44208.1 arginine--tRNA ligase [Acidimicrobiia bacterium]MYI18921.1 arginine--tRNA ligase [Acidimicrobiia bacterium]
MIRRHLIDALATALARSGVEPLPATIEIGRPARPEHGDWSSNVALVCARAAGRNPRDLAGELVEHISADPPAHLRTVEVAGPGFVNFHLDDGWLHDVLRQVVGDGVDGYARSDVGAGTTVNVEFVSANPTGPLHVGGGRWAAYGDSLCNILARCGFVPHREYYLNDRGRQMDAFAESLVARKQGTEPPEDGYHGDYIREWAAEMPDGADALEWGYARARRDVAESLARLGVTFDTWSSERALVSSGAVAATLETLEGRGATYCADGAVWLRIADAAHEEAPRGGDRVLVRSNGEPTYLLPDIAYHADKLARGFDLLIDVWGADHHGHVEPLATGVGALGHRREQLEIVLGQLVTVMRGGTEAKISKRAGNVVLLDDLVDLVGPDAARMTFLLQSLGSRQTIDLDVVAAQSMENPVFYVQYAHARICSLMATAAERGVARPPLDEVALELLADPRELEVLRTLHALGDVLSEAARERAPHKLTTWARQLAGAFHGFYHDCPVLRSDIDPARAAARLWLTEAARIGLVIALDLLGVTAPERMESLEAGAPAGET